MTDRTDPRDRAALQKRSLIVLAIAQLLSGLGLAAGIVVGALLAKEMIGSDSSAGLPIALFTGGAAISAWAIGQVSQRHGRRGGLGYAYLIGAVGGGGIVLAAVIDSVALLLPMLVIYGTGTAASFQARYAGADLATPETRARAVSLILVATTAGAVAGPLLTGVTGDFSESLGVTALAGPFMLATVAYVLAGLVLLIFLRPDPLLTAQRWQREAEGTASAEEDHAFDPTAVRIATLVLVLGQLVMVAVMTMTPVYMRDHDHGLTATGAVIALHVAAMFLPSPLTGVLVDRIGRAPMIAASGITLIASGVMAAIVPAGSATLLAVSLILLGLGWNFSVVAGTALITDATPLATRAGIQGRADLFVQISGAAGGLGSGFMVSATSFTGLALGGGAVALLMLPLMFGVSRPQPAT